MDIINYTTARQNLAQTMDKVIDDHAPITVTRGNDKAVVIISLEDWDALQETIYLMRSPANAQRLLDGIKAFEEGRDIIVQNDLVGS